MESPEQVAPPGARAPAAGRSGAPARLLRWVLRPALVAALVLGTAGAVPGPAAAAAPSLPPGFELRPVPSGQSALLTDAAPTPEGGWLTTGKNGRVAYVSPDGAATTLADLPVETTQDLGLTGVAVAPDYATSRRVYTVRTVDADGAWTMRLSAWTAAGDPAPSSLTDERVLWDLPAGSDAHATTTVVAADDGTLWVTIGDSADFRFTDPQALRALDPAVGYGKLVHVLPDGRGVPSNPFYDAAAPSSWRSRVYASGFRSPFRFSLDPGTGAPVLGDVGWDSVEEVDLVRPGASYGWPCWEGDIPTPGYADLAACRGVTGSAPLWTYRHGPAGTAVTGGVVYTGSSYPAQYQGAYFFGDYASQRISTLRYDAQGRLVRAPEADGFGRGIGAPVAFTTAANGDVVYADIASSTLQRLVYVPGNRPPTADAVVTTDPATRTAVFDATGSSDLDGDALTYRWDFGDGTTGEGPRVSHAYDPPGTAALTARLTVTDPQGAQGTSSLTVVPANHSPVVALVAPPPDRLFAVGEPVQATATATDAEDGPLPVTWTVVLVHCSGGYCHDHPGQTVSGGTYDLPFVDHGDQTRLEVTASATDRFGVRSARTFTAEPRLRALTITGNTPSAVTVDGQPHAVSQVTAGSRVSVIAPVVAGDGVATFERWGDSASRERDLVMPDADLTLDATYLTPIDRRYAGDAALRGLLGAPTAPETGDAAQRSRTYAGGRLHWSPAAGVHEVHGAILADYLAGGGLLGFGVPTTDELPTPDGAGRFNQFALAGSSVYWTPGTGAHAVHGDIAARWAASGYERGVHGYPTSDELTTPGGRGRFNRFQDGGVYWLPGLGARSVHGDIHREWARLRWEQGLLGFPLTSETLTPDGTGRFNAFEGGSVYWSPGTGAHEVHGAILDRWRALGWERSYLGYPTSDEHAVAGGRRSDFQHGYMFWDAATGRVADRRS